MVSLQDEDPGRILLRQVMDLWISPEISRRREAGQLDSSFTLRYAQVVMNVGRENEVRLNDEVRAVARVRLRGDASVDVGDQILAADVEDVEGFELTESDPDAGHFTVILLNGRCYIGWDARYNATRAGNLLKAARQFLSSAHASLAAGDLNSFVENAWSAVEMTAKARLMLLPDQAILESKKHQYIFQKYSKWTNLNEDERPFARAFKELTRRRRSARFLEGDLDFTDTEATEILDLADAFADAVGEMVPSRKKNAL